MAPTSILQKILDAHGGLGFWRGLESIEAEISAWGFLFTLKRRPSLRHVRVSARVHEPRFRFHDCPSPGMDAELLGNEEARLVGRGGAIVESRRAPRGAMRGLRRQLYWDVLDFAYFGGYALWNYLLTPFLFLWQGVRCETLPPGGGLPASWTALEVTFPASLPTHSRRQTFYFDEALRLRRLDYTAEVVGPWARAAHLCQDYRDFGGLRAPSRRRVYPLPWGSRPLPGPTLVAIDVHDAWPVRAADAGGVR